MNRFARNRLFALSTSALLIFILAGSIAAGERVQKGNLRASFTGKLNPVVLPREGIAPISVSVGGKVTTADGSPPPPLHTIEIAINRNGRFDATGLPRCTLAQIQPTTTADALRACRQALVGEGRFEANVQLSAHQAQFPSNGKMYVFNSILHGRPALLGHVYGTTPVPTSFTLSFEVKSAHGTYGSLLIARLPSSADSGSITGLSMTLHRIFSYRGARHSYLSAGCPTPKGIGIASFPFVRASFGFAGGLKLSSTLTRSCRVR